MDKLDLVFLKQGKPVAVVEAKARPVPESFQNAVRQQLRRYVTATSSPWSILVDPNQMAIFRNYEMNKPWATLSTGEVLGTANIQSKIVGERILLEAVSRWIRELPHHREILERHPELQDFIKDVSDGITSTEEWLLRV